MPTGSMPAGSLSAGSLSAGSPGATQPAGSLPAASHSRRVPTLIGCAHGTRARAGRDVVRQLLGMVSTLVDAPVREAFVDVQAPAVADVVDDLAEPSRSTRDESDPMCVVVPVLLSTGYHVRHDIASAVAGRAATATGPLGPDPRLARVMAERLREAGWTGDAPLVMAAAGSSDPAGVAMVEQQRDLLAQELGVSPESIVIGYAAAASPDVATAVAQARGRGPVAGGSVAVASYMLAPGHFQRVVEESGAEVVAAPLGAHPLVAEIVAERYLSAIGS
ncbi:sirohydrochlorin chelatase [Brachybacterium sp. EF45031]|nr:sirohydrochlorin chelatase [Brachybacterium sillae]